MQNGSTAFRFVRLAVLPFFAVKSTLLKVRCTHYSEIFLYSPESLFASFLWKYPNSKTLMERRSSIRFCNFFTPSAVGWTSIACCAPSIRREMRKYLQFSITRTLSIVFVTIHLLYAPKYIPEMKGTAVWRLQRRKARIIQRCISMLPTEELCLCNCISVHFLADLYSCACLHFADRRFLFYCQ